MNSRIKELWLAALRSRKFKQVQGRLRQNSKYCCLGVLCQLHSEATKTKWPRGKAYLEARICLPDEVVHWAGLTSSNPSVDMVGRSHYLSDLNDNGASFQKIANIIEKYLTSNS